MLLSVCPSLHLSANLFAFQPIIVRPAAFARCRHLSLSLSNALCFYVLCVYDYLYVDACICVSPSLQTII